MSTSNKSKLIEGSNLKINSGNDFINGFYFTFIPNIEDYLFNNPSIDVLGGTKSIFLQIFGSTLSSSEIDTLVGKSFSSRIVNNPYVFYLLSNLSDDDFTSLLTTGTIPSIPTPAPQSSKDQIAFAATLSQPTLNNNYKSSMQFIRNNQFSCTFSYVGYVGGKNFSIDFSKTIDPSTIGAALGLIAFVDNQDINSDDAKLLSNLIKSYSNTSTFITKNLDNISLQKSASSYFTTFESKYSTSVSKFVKDTTPENLTRTGDTNAPPNAIKRPTLVDDNLIIKNNDTLIDPSEVGVSPSGITLNQFTQPNFNDILSILDIIRNTDSNTHIKEFEDSISIDGGDGTTVVGTQSSQDSASILGTSSTPAPMVTFKKSVVDALSTSEKNSSKQAINGAIDQTQKDIAQLDIQVKKTMNTDEFTLTSIIAGIGSAGDTNKRPNTETLREQYNRLASALKNEVDSKGQTTSANALIQQASYKDVQGWNENFKKRLGISAPINDGISRDTINKIYKNTMGSPPVEFNTLVSLTNKSNTQEVNKKVQAIAQKIADQIKSTEAQKIKLQDNITKYKKLLADLG